MIKVKKVKKTRVARRSDSITKTKKSVKRGPAPKAKKTTKKK